jgi:hypothetical protein
MEANPDWSDVMKEVHALMNACMHARAHTHTYNIVRSMPIKICNGQSNTQSGSQILATHSCLQLPNLI